MITFHFTLWASAVWLLVSRAASTVAAWTVSNTKIVETRCGWYGLSSSPSGRCWCNHNHPKFAELRLRESRLLSLTTLCVLTDRQMQFWEDVEDGINDVSTCFPNESIDRIREFAKSAQGLTPLPTPAAPGHEPSEENVDGLMARAFWEFDNEYFPWWTKLETNADIIIEEFTSKLKASESGLFASDSTWQNNVMGSGWSAIRLQRLGVWNIENCDQFPRTYELIQSLNIPLAVRGVCFARQGPNSGVATHSDGRNFILTAHLGVRVPEGCWIQVGEERREWEEGKILVLDTSFRHSTGNPTDEDRHVLIIDFWHPGLTKAERAALEFVYDLRNKFESGEVPFRMPRSSKKEKLGGGVASIWNALKGAAQEDKQ